MAFSFSSVKCSIDKIKLKCTRILANTSINSTFSLWLCRLPWWIECVEEYPENLYLGKYRYSFSLRVKGQKEGIFYLAYWYNGSYQDQAEKPRYFYIEYNPNKGGKSIYEEFCCNYAFKIREISYIDLAFDIPGADVNDIYIDTLCDVMSYGKVYNKTWYIAPKEDQSGRVKCYQKDVERANVDEEIPKTLRIEVSIKDSYLLGAPKIVLSASVFAKLQRVCDRVNSIHIKKENEIPDEWQAFALSCLTPYQLSVALSKMSYHTRSKYKGLILEKTYATLELEPFELALEIASLMKPWQENKIYRPRWYENMKASKKHGN